jgi:RNA polymerase sigma factor (TIGR02999 family)
MPQIMVPTTTTPKPFSDDFPQKTDFTQAGDVEALGAILPEVYEQLRELAEGYLRGERPNHTLQPTALVHEAYLRLRQQRKVDWSNRAQVLGVAAQMMRRILKNHAAAKSAAKRGGPDSLRLTLDEAVEFYQQNDVNVAAVDDALQELESVDPRQGQIVELRFFGGLTVEEIAVVLHISPATVKREWSTAKLWLQHWLSQTGS